MSNVFTAFQDNEESRPVIEAIAADNFLPTSRNQNAFVEITSSKPLDVSTESPVILAAPSIASNVIASPEVVNEKSR